MDYTNAFGAEFRQVADRTHEGQPVRALVASRVYATDCADLWSAVTDAERLPRWFLPVTGELKLDGRYQLEGNASGSILRCDPPEILEVTWEFGGNISWVHVRIAKDGAGARLTLEHLMPKDEASEEHWRQYGPGAGGVGWDLSFLVLALHLDRGGQAIDFSENEAWMVSDAGKAFIGQSADLWYQAHVRAGEDPQVAQAMADRTAAFYTGS